MYPNDPGYFYPYSSAPLNNYQPTQVPRVHGEDGAKAYPMQPNSSILLLDETAPIIWLKQTDGGGFPTLKAYSISEYKKEDPEKKTFDNFEKRLQRLEETVNGKSNSKGFNNQQRNQSEPKQ